MELIIISGPPYCGKGTQCQLLQSRLNYKHISTGDEIRKEKKKNTYTGKILKKLDENGELIPDDLMQVILNSLLTQYKNEKGIILDGYPRTLDQAKVLIESGMSIKTVVNINVSKEELLNRAELRSKLSDREDDKPELYTKRINIFEEQTLPAINYLSSYYKVIHVNGDDTIENVTHKLINIIETE